MRDNEKVSIIGQEQNKLSLSFFREKSWMALCVEETAAETASVDLVVVLV